MGSLARLAAPAVLSLALAMPGVAQAAPILSGHCPVQSKGVWESGGAIAGRGDPDDFYVIALWKDGLSASFRGDMDTFTNCAVSDAAISCKEWSSGSGDTDPDLLKTLDLDRKTGAFHATAWRKSAPAKKRDSTGVCEFD